VYYIHSIKKGLISFPFTHRISKSHLANDNFHFCFACRAVFFGRLPNALQVKQIEKVSGTSWKFGTPPPLNFSSFSPWSVFATRPCIDVASINSCFAHGLFMFGALYEGSLELNDYAVDGTRHS